MSYETLQHTYGSGEVYFAPFLAGTTTRKAFRYFGNTPEFTITAEQDELEHMDTDHGVRFEDDAIQTSSKFSAKIMTDNINQENVALYLTGSTAIITDSSGSGVALSISEVEIGGMYQLGVTTAKPTGDRNVSSVVVKDSSGGTTTYVAGTDYLVDAISGTITFLSGGTIADGDPAYITYTRAASTRPQTISGANAVEGAIMFKSFNPKGPKKNYLLPRVRLRPDGDFALKGDAWLQIGYALKVLKLPPFPHVLCDGETVLG